MELQIDRREITPVLIEEIAQRTPPARRGAPSAFTRSKPLKKR